MIKGGVRMQNIQTMKEKIGKKARKQMVLGIILCVFNLLMLFTTFTSLDLKEPGVPGAIGLYIILIGIGIWILYQSIKKKQLLVLFESYRVRFTGDELAEKVEYEYIAQQLGKNLNVVKKEVDLLIKNKLWEEVYGGECAIRKTMLSKISVTCHSCGASCTVDMLDTTKKCEYCGESLADEIHNARYQSKQ